MTTESPIEARLREIEDILGGDIDCEGPVLDDLAWLVALVRRYRAALERIEALPLYRVGTAYGEGEPQWEPRYVIAGLPDIIAREALNEEG